MAGRIDSFRDLVAWQRAVDASVEIYRMTAGFPDSERFGLVSQLRRAGVSIASNIAEGYGRGSSSDYLRFLRMARGSLFEVETQLLIASRLGYMNEESFTQMESRLRECGRVLAGLIRSIE